MSQNHDDQIAFARTAGPQGKLTEEQKTKVDAHTGFLFRRHCAINGTDAATILRDCIYMIVYQKSYRAMVVEMLQHDIDRTDALLALKGLFEAPQSEDFGFTGSQEVRS